MELGGIQIYINSVNREEGNPGGELTKRAATPSPPLADVSTHGPGDLGAGRGQHHGLQHVDRDLAQLLLHLPVVHSLLGGAAV